MPSQAVPPAEPSSTATVLAIAILQGQSGIVQLTGPVEADAVQPLAVIVTLALLLVTVEPAEPETVQVLVMT
jgi:hypothetical protein